MDRLYFTVTQKGRVSPITRKGLSLLLGLVRRPQHLPLGLQTRSPERSPLSSVDSTICRTLPNSGVPPSGTLLLSLLGLPVRPTSFRTIHRQSLVHLHTRYRTQSHTVKSHNNTISCNYSRNYFNSRNKLVQPNNITKRLYLIIKIRLIQ